MTLITTESTSTKGESDWEKILFPVEERKVLTPRMPGCYHEESDYKAIINGNTGETLSIVSSKYGVVDNISTLNRFETLFNDSRIDVERGRAYMTKNRKKTVMEVIFPEKDFSINGDDMDFRGYISNSFDGSSSIQLQLGHMRHICMNLDLMIGRADLDFKTTHAGNASERMNEKLTFFIDESYNDSKEYLNNLSEGSFQSKNEVVEFVENEGNEIVADRYKDSVIEVWDREYENSLSWWYVYNAYTYVLTHALRVNMVSRMSAYRQLSQYFNNMMNGSSAYKKKIA